MLNEAIVFQKNEGGSHVGTDSKVIGQKFDGSSVLSFLWIKIVEAFFLSDGTLPESQTTRIVSVRKERR